MTKLHTIQRSVVICFIAIAVVVLSAIAYIQYTGHSLLSVQTSSMEPALSAGDLIINKPTNNYTVDDIVSYEQDGVSVTHRIVSIDNESIVTKGDNNQGSDQPITKSQITGETIKVVPFAGRLVNLNNPVFGLIIFVYIPAIAILFSETRRLYLHFEGTKGYVYGKSYKKIPKINYKALNSLAFAILVGVLVSNPVAALLKNSATIGGNTISTGSLNVAIKICSFPSHETLLSYAPGDANYPLLHEPPLPLPETIRAGTYSITMDSFDFHTLYPNNRTQPNERWMLEFYDVSGTLVARTLPTDDLPDDEDENSTVHDLFLTADVVAFRYVHEAMLSGLEMNNYEGADFDDLSQEEKNQVVWNSIHPSCFEILQHQ